MGSKPFTIVCAVDFAETSPWVVDHALEEAHRHAEAALHFITVLETGKGVFSHAGPTILDLEDADRNLRLLVQEQLPAFADSDESASRSLRFHIRSGTPDLEILELSQEARADWIVVGRYGVRRRRGAMGSIATRIVNAATCTVHVVQLADYQGVEEDYAQCPRCVQLREDTKGDAWFCYEHSTGRTPRLMRNIGVTTHTPGWGFF